MNIILSPHYDDAVLSLGGFIQQNPNTAVVTVFTHGMPLRKAENDAALAFLGVKPENILDLDYKYNRDRVGKETLPGLIRKIADGIKSGDQEIKIYCPIALSTLEYWHVDHVLLRKKICKIIKSLEPNDAKVEWYLYEDLPYISMSQAENPIDIQRAAEKRYGIKLEMEMMHIDLPEWAKKISAARMYESEINAGNINRYMQTYEVVYKIKSNY
jgi:hypothetical protein